MQPSGDMQANAETADSPGLTQVHTLEVQDVSQAQTVETVSLAIRTHLWISWARIALKHEAAAHAVRQDAQQTNADLARILLQEADAGLVGICASAFALEALSRELDELGIVPTATRAAWKKNRLSDDKQILELLKLAVDPKGLVNLWRRELPWLFKVRGSSVHYRGSFEAPQPHPLGTNVTSTQLTYSAENSTRAVNLLLGILERCRDKPKPPARDWSRGMRGAVDALIGRRGREYEPWP
jgi:hypothetical protein